MTENVRPPEASLSVSPEATPEASLQLLKEIRETVCNRASAVEIQQQAFEHLYEELRQYKDDFVFQAAKPLLLDLLLFYDSLAWFHSNIPTQGASPEVVAEAFQYLVDELLEVLARQDIVPMEPRKTFDRTVHKAVKVTGTTDAGLDRTIQTVIKRGFLRAERVLRPEEVVIRRLGSFDGTPDPTSVP